MSQTVIGIFSQHSDAQRAVSALQEAGFESAHIDVSSRDHFEDSDREGRNTRSESVGGFFSNLFGDDDDDDMVRTRDSYSEAARRGTVVTVHTEDMTRAERAADVLDEYGAIDADEASTKLRERGVAKDDRDTHLETVDSDLSRHENYTGTTGARADMTNASRATDGKIEVVKEDVKVGKREVTTGGVRVRSRVIERPVTETLRLREEHVEVKRTPVNRPVSAGDDAFNEETISMTEKSEVPVVSKTARVVEEITVGKTSNERQETVKETARETEVDVENVASERISNDGGRTADRGKNRDGRAFDTDSDDNAAERGAKKAGNAVERTGDKAHNALDRDNDGDVIDLNDGDGRIG